jgi:alkanesulfonate monooxygenase SsuD/methylene tetrahydromethanopterin reductase-like flavin-dependent oxidoreductase (luciferase family)
MKLGLVLDGESLERLSDQARTAETAGLDIACLADRPDADTALIRAGAVAARTSVIRLAAVVRVGTHPLEIAEASVVADNCSNGRLILVLHEPDGDRALLAETVEVVLAGLAPRPFRHEGERWTIPGNLPENDQQEERVVVTPFSVQAELPVWLAGPGGGPVAASWGLARVSPEGEPPQTGARAWNEIETALGSAARRSRRPSMHFLYANDSGEFDVDALVQTLRAEQRAWGADVALIRLPEDLSDAARAGVAHRLAEHVRPRVTMYELPAGIEDHWKEVLA